MNIQEQTKRVSRNAGRIKAMIMAKLESLPDNPRINRLNSNCFTIMSSDLGDNWTPAHHDFKKQYQLIYDKLKAVNVFRVLPFLNVLIKTGKLKVSEHYTQKLHPDVQKHLQSLIS